MRFGTRVVPMVGLLAALGRLAAATTAAGRWRGGPRRGHPLGRADRGEASGSLIRKDVR